MNKSTIIAVVILEVLFAASMFITGRASTLDNDTLKYNTMREELREAQYKYIYSTENLLDSIEWDCHWLDITGERDVYIEYIEAKDRLDSLMSTVY